MLEEEEKFGRGSTRGIYEGKGQAQASAKRQVKVKTKTVRRPKGKGKVREEDLAQGSIPPGSYVCEIGGQKFGRPYDLERHKETIQGHTKFKGRIPCACGKTYSRDDSQTRQEGSNCRLRRR